MARSNTMQYLDKDNNPIAPERWQWVAYYADGTTLFQFDPNVEIYHYFAEVETDKVKSFGLISPRAGEIKSAIKIIPKNAKLIHYYDNIVHQPLNGAAVRYRLYCFGYEVNGEKKIWSVLPTDVVVEGSVDDLEVL